MPPPLEPESSDQESIPASSRRTAKGGPKSMRSAEEQDEQAAIAARIRPAAPAPALVAGPLRATPCLPCLRSAVSGRSKGACHDVAGAKRAQRCFKCSSGHKCLRLPSALRAPARSFVSLLAAGAPKKEVEAARGELRSLLKEHPGGCAAEQPSESEEESEEEEEAEDEDEDEDEPAGGAALRSERKEALKKGLCALVDLLFEE